MSEFSPVKSFREHQRGATAIEFAVILPLLVLLFYGLVCYALILLDKNSLSAISSSAARNAASTRDADMIMPRVQQAIDNHRWISSRIIPCQGQSGYHTLLAGGQLQICLRATPVPMPTINLGFIQLPPENQAALLRSTATVLWDF